MAIRYGPVGAPDIVGNRYPVIEVGNQIWMTTNLKTTKYNDGTAISTGYDNLAWAGLSTGAYAVYNNDSSLTDVYGLYYNWFAVDTGKLAPEGWHVATDPDWQTLEMYLGMSQEEADVTGFRGTNEGSKLAGRADLWNNGDLENDPEFGTSGFNLLPGGIRSITGAYQQRGTYCDTWTTLTSAGGNAYKRIVANTGTQIGRYVSDKNYGYSVRCVRDD